MNGHPEIGLPPTTIPTGQILAPITITIPADGTDISFNCTNTQCGNSQQHEGMLGVIHVVP